MNRILAIDPSGTGTTGVYFKDLDWEQFSQFTGQEWKNHYRFIADMVEIYHPDLLLFETTNFINSKGKDMTSLLKLLGTLETLSLPCTWLRIEAIPVDQVKRLRSKLLKGEQSITGLEFLKGKGWHYQGQKISVHCLDAYLVYWLWNDKEIDKENNLSNGFLKTDKTKPKTKKKLSKKTEPDWDDLPDLPEDDDRFNCEPGCERCGQIYCICDDIYSEEPEGCNCEDGCPSCSSYEPKDIEDRDQEETEDQEDKDHDM